MNNEELLALRDVRAQARTGAARATRLAAGLSLAEVASALGVSHVTVYRWEVGQRTPTGDRALAYKQLLDQLAPRARRRAVAAQ